MVMAGYLLRKWTCYRVYRLYLVEISFQNSSWTISNKYVKVQPKDCPCSLPVSFWSLLLAVCLILTYFSFSSSCIFAHCCTDKNQNRGKTEMSMNIHLWGLSASYILFDISISLQPHQRIVIEIVWEIFRTWRLIFFSFILNLSFIFRGL